MALTITKDGEPCITKLESQYITKRMLGLPWLSNHGYKVTHDGWILGPSGKWLLWLPHHWRLGDKKRTIKWDGHYLALLHGALQEPVILDIQPEELLND